MFGRTPSQPKYWKALVAFAPFVAIVAWSLSLFHVHIVEWLLITIAAVIWLFGSAAINARVSNDWRAEYDMNVMITEHRSSVARNTRIDDK